MFFVIIKKSIFSVNHVPLLVYGPFGAKIFFKFVSYLTSISWMIVWTSSSNIYKPRYIITIFSPFSRNQFVWPILINEVGRTVVMVIDNYCLCNQNYFFGEAIIGPLSTRNLLPHSLIHFFLFATTRKAIIKTRW